MRQQVQVCTARFKKVFPLAVHIAGHKPSGGEAHHFTPVPSHNVVWGGPKGERQWKNFSKPFKWTLELYFLQATAYLVSHVKRFGTPEIVDGSPKLSP